MDSQNIKVYLGISFALIILFILILVIPFSKKTTNDNPQPTPYNLQPTSVETNSFPSNQVTNNQAFAIPADFTGVAEEELPPQVLDTSLQKKDLRQQTPLDLSAFTIDFDYNQDKFMVILKDPKDQARQEFENWRSANYPGLSSDQFLLK